MLGPQADRPSQRAEKRARMHCVAPASRQSMCNQLISVRLDVREDVRLTGIIYLHGRAQRIISLRAALERCALCLPLPLLPCAETGSPRSRPRLKGTQSSRAGEANGHTLIALFKRTSISSARHCSAQLRVERARPA